MSGSTAASQFCSAATDRRAGSHHSPLRARRVDATAEFEERALPQALAVTLDDRLDQRDAVVVLELRRVLRRRADRVVQHAACQGGSQRREAAPDLGVEPLQREHPLDAEHAPERVHGRRHEVVALARLVGVVVREILQPVGQRLAGVLELREVALQEDVTPLALRAPSPEAVRRSRPDEDGDHRHDRFEHRPSGRV
jgi:hypothetical protein